MKFSRVLIMCSIYCFVLNCTCLAIIILVEVVKNPISIVICVVVIILLIYCIYVSSILLFCTCLLFDGLSSGYSLVHELLIEYIR